MTYLSTSPDPAAIMRRLDGYFRPLPTDAHSGITCAHCGGEALGYAKVTDSSGHDRRVCHHETRDCYKAITVWGEILGQPGITD